MTARPRLFVGNRNYSSWSLRAWLCLEWAGIAHEQIAVELDQPGYGTTGIAELRGLSPTAKVPVLHTDNAVVWDSLAIAEWAAEQAPELWPADPTLRARARSLAAEMHAGFAALRRDLPMNISRRCVATALPQETRVDIARIDEMWSEGRAAAAGGGPYLCGERSIADAFYLPVATCMRTYAVALSAPAQAYADLLLADPSFRTWEQAVLSEPYRPFSRAPIDDLYRDSAS